MPHSSDTDVAESLDADVAGTRYPDVTETARGRFLRVPADMRASADAKFESDSKRLWRLAWPLCRCSNSRTPASRVIPDGIQPCTTVRGGPRTGRYLDPSPCRRLRARRSAAFGNRLAYDGICVAARMVNTLAKAGAARTGVLEAEIDVLRVYLDTARYQALAQHPDVDAALLLNTFLLAVAEGIATGDLLSANYHFCWFRTLSAPPASKWASNS